MLFPIARTKYLEKFNHIVYILYTILCHLITLDYASKIDTRMEIIRCILLQTIAIENVNKVYGSDFINSITSVKSQHYIEYLIFGIIYDF